MKVKRKRFPKIDIGLTWAKGINIWGQLGMIAGMANTLMLIGVFYTTTVYPNFEIPLWLYLVFIFFVAIMAISFIIKYGISGYYRFFSHQTNLSEVDRKVELIMKHLGVSDEVLDSKRKRSKKK